MANDILVLADHLRGQLSDTTAELVGKAKELAGATGGHSRQRAWMLGPERIERTSPSMPASCCSGWRASIEKASAGTAVSSLWSVSESSSWSRKLRCGSR